MDSMSPLDMQGEKQDGIPEEAIAAEIDFRINQVKEDIRSTFTRHKKSLAAREIWLLDQLDSIKTSILMSVFKKQISLAEMRGRLQQSVAFSQVSKDGEFHESIEKVLDPLSEKAKQYIQKERSSIPSINFVHDKISLKSAILSYGGLETDFQPGSDDADSCNSEHSWDLVDEKSEVEACDKATKNGFCVVRANCCMEKEIEDMDMSKLLIKDGMTSLNPPADELKSACKANELCNSISDCVCDKPCLSISSQNLVSNPAAASDTLSKLKGKLMAIYQGDDGVEGMIDESDISVTPEEHSITDPVLQVSANVQNILSGASCVCNNTGYTSSNDFISVLHQKLQSIIDGGSNGQLEMQEELDLHTNSFADHVSYKSLPWEIATVTPVIFEDDIVSNLHKRLENIHQQSPDVIVASELKRQPHATLDSLSDPVQALSSQLQQILAC